LSGDVHQGHIRVAAVQPDLIGGQPAHNLEVIRRTVQELAGDAPPDLVVLPEMFEGEPEPSDGSRARSFLCELAREFDTHVVGGSCEIVDSDGCRRNASHVVHRRGEVVGRYDKRVLFSSETARVSAGREAGVFELDSIRVGVLICADLWHPELTRELVGRVDVLAIPARTGVPTQEHAAYARRLWHAMALTRAMENGLVVIVADWPEASHQHVPTDGAPKAYYTAGATTIVDPSHRPDIERIQRFPYPKSSSAIVSRVDLSALGAYQTYRRGVGLLPGL